MMECLLYGGLEKYYFCFYLIGFYSIIIKRKGKYGRSNSKLRILKSDNIQVIIDCKNKEGLNFMPGGIKLEAQNRYANDRMLALVAIGLLYSLETEHIHVDEVHAYMFNPFTLNILREIDAAPELVDIWHRALFLEDVKKYFSEDILKKNIMELLENLFRFLDNTQWEPNSKNKWLKIL